MITVNIVAGPHCSLKTTWFKRAFNNLPNCITLSAEELYDELSTEPIIIKDGFLDDNFEDIWMDTVVHAIEAAPSDLSIVVDGVTLNDDHLAYNFSTAEAVYRFIDIVRDAAEKNFIHKQFQFVIHWLALPLPLRQILNHRRKKPYPTDQLRRHAYWDAKPDEPDIKVIIHNTDGVFRDLYIEELL